MTKQALQSKIRCYGTAPTENSLEKLAIPKVILVSAHDNNYSCKKFSIFHE